MKVTFTILVVCLSCHIFSQQIIKQNPVITKTFMSENGQNYFVYEYADSVILTIYNLETKREKLIHYCPSDVCLKYFNTKSVEKKTIDIEQAVLFVDKPELFKSMIIINPQY